MTKQIFLFLAFIFCFKRELNQYVLPAYGRGFAFAKQGN